MTHDVGRARALMNFVLMTIAEVLLLPPMKWAIRNVFPQKGLGLIYGASGTGKSFICLDLCAKLALGEPWFGYPVAEGLRAALFVLEGQSGLRQRVEAWQQLNGRAIPAGVHCFCGSFSINDENDVKRAIAGLQAVGGVDVIVIDTLNRASQGADENRSNEMGRIIAGASALQQGTSSFVILVHHSGKDESRGPRGHSSLYPVMDAVMEVRRLNDGDRSWQLLKVKDGEDGDSRRFVLESIEIGIDEFGLPLKSAAIRETTDPGTSPEKKGPSGKHPTAVLRRFNFLVMERELIAELEGQPRDPATPVGISYEECVSDCKAFIDVDDPSRLTERTKDAIKSLIKSGHIEERDGMLYLPT